MPSVMQRVGTPNAHHNLDNNYRKHLDNVDASLSQHNEVIRHKSVEVIYAEHLQPAFEEFNERQKRKDRRLDVKWDCNDALGYQRALDRAAKESDNKKLRETGRPPIREIVWQFGNPEQGYGCAGQTDEHRQQIKEMLLEVQEEAERRYPQFAWGDVVFHADEVSYDADDKEMGSMHLHSSFVPLCFQNKQGMSVQVAFERCLAEMGFKSFDDWKHDLDRIMEDVLERHGLERTVMENHEEHQSSKEFHRQQLLIKQTKELEEQVWMSEEKMAVNQELAIVYEQQADEQQERLIIATEKTEKLQQELVGLRNEKDALQGDLELLRGKKVEMERELPALTAQISEAKSELQLIRAAIKEELAEGCKQIGTAGLQRLIEKARRDSLKDKKLTQLQSFVDEVQKHWQRHPEAYEKFKTDVADNNSQHQRTRLPGRDR